MRRLSLKRPRRLGTADRWSRGDSLELDDVLRSLTADAQSR